MNATQTNKTRAVLDTKLAELCAIFRNREPLEAVNEADANDRVRNLADREEAARERNRAWSTMADVREAISLLDRGEYGRCAECGEKLSPRRLAAVPWALRCTDCESAAEELKGGLTHEQIVQREYQHGYRARAKGYIDRCESVTVRRGA